MTPKTRLRQRHGFTLVELLMVVALLAILAAIVIPAVSNGRCVALDNRLKSTISDCEKTIRGTSPTVAAVQGCITSAQTLINDYCKDCGQIGTAASGSITVANAAIAEYRAGLSDDADKAKIVNLTKPTGC